MGRGEKDTSMERQSKSNNLTFWIILGAAVVVGAFFFSGNQSGLTYRSFANRSFPSLNAPGTWLNTNGNLSWDDLSGSVVWLEFSFLH